MERTSEERIASGLNTARDLVEANSLNQKSKAVMFGESTRL
ncbi:hypothetical protein PN466_21580 [Roseofilum reptotaenium CS-1145]|nr:hypothetical protein [Roseofilum sp. Guam]MDB9519538.1 hypothetical protein [Roseofilum reptotaenium CS-1145]